jgi:D-3-phosphoglycerate dehydrogenase
MDIPWVRRYDNLQDALRDSDVVSLHLPLVPETTALINDAAIGLLRPGALLVNVSRGGLIDEPAVARALADGRLGGGAFDVLASEPPPAVHPLLASPNTILSPHIAWLSSSSQARLQRWTLQSVLDTLNGRPITHGRLAIAGTR